MPRKAPRITRAEIYDDPAFRPELQRVSDLSDEHVRGAGWIIAELEEESGELGPELARERERLLKALVEPG